MLMFRYVCNSSPSSFVAYGISTVASSACERPIVGRISKFCPVEPMKRGGPSHSVQTNSPWRSLNTGTVPQPVHTWIDVPSERSIIDSRRKLAPPWAINPSRSISPMRRPPSSPRPPVGWWVRCSRRPSPRAFHLSSVMCFKRMPKTGPTKIDVGI